MISSDTQRILHAQPITVEAFRPYGQLILPSEDGKAFDAEDAQLKLDAGTPRFYIMRLGGRGCEFDRITRHQQCTQCLGAMGGKDWLLGVAPPSPAAHPTPDEIVAFHIPGYCFIKLNVGTWHAGPYFEHDQMDFFNLELADTNIVDHETCHLGKTYGLRFSIERSP